MEVEKVRVGRINAIKLVPYSDVKKLLRYFAIRGVAREAKKEDELATINTLQAYNDNNLRQKISSRNSLNTMVIDGIEKKMLEAIEKNPDIYSSKSSIELIKNMNLVRKGSKITALDLLAKSEINNAILNTKNITDTQDLKQDEIKISTAKSQKNKKQITNHLEAKDKDKKINHLETKQKDKIPSIIEKYAKNLKELEEKNRSIKQNV